MNSAEAWRLNLVDSSSTTRQLARLLSRAREKDNNMKKTLVLTCLCCLLPFTAFAAQKRESLQLRIDAAKIVLDEIMATPDNNIPMEILEQATCVGVVPGMKKGALIWGAQYGQGVVTCRTGHGWSAPVFIRMEGGSFGLQIGGQSTDLVLVAVNEKGFQDLLKSKFKIGADASAAAGPVGRSGQAATDWKMSAELLSYSRNKGVFAGIEPGWHQRQPEHRRYPALPWRFAKLPGDSQGRRGGSFRRGAVCEDSRALLCQSQTTIAPTPPAIRGSPATACP